MTVSNKKIIKFYLRGMTFLASIHIFILFFSKTHLQYENIAKTIFFASLLLLIILFYRLKCFEFDYSGEVISIKSYHPLFPQAEKRVEFPKNKLDNFNVSKNNGTTLLKLSLKMVEDKTIRIRYTIHGLNDILVNDLERSLQKTLETYKI